MTALRAHRARLQFRQLPGNTFEELIDDHSSGTADHALAEAGDGTAGADIAGIAKKGAGVVGGELNRAFAFDEARSPATVDGHLVIGRGQKIVETDRSAENAADRADTEPQLHVIRAVTGLFEFIASRKTLRDAMCVGQERPHGKRLDLFKCELSFNLHFSRRVPLRLESLDGCRYARGPDGNRPTHGYRRERSRRRSHAGTRLSTDPLPASDPSRRIQTW